MFTEEESRLLDWASSLDAPQRAGRFVPERCDSPQRSAVHRAAETAIRLHDSGAEGAGAAHEGWARPAEDISAGPESLCNARWSQIKRRADRFFGETATSRARAGLEPRCTPPDRDPPLLSAADASHPPSSCPPATSTSFASDRRASGRGPPAHAAHSRPAATPPLPDAALPVWRAEEHRRAALPRDTLDRLRAARRAPGAAHAAPTDAGSAPVTATPRETISEQVRLAREAVAKALEPAPGRAADAARASASAPAPERPQRHCPERVRTFAERVGARRRAEAFAEWLAVTEASRRRFAAAARFAAAKLLWCAWRAWSDAAEEGRVARRREQAEERKHRAAGNFHALFRRHSVLRTWHKLARDAKERRVEAARAAEEERAALEAALAAEQRKEAVAVRFRDAWLRHASLVAWRAALTDLRQEREDEQARRRLRDRMGGLLNLVAARQAAVEAPEAPAPPAAHAATGPRPLARQPWRNLDGRVDHMAPARPWKAPRGGSATPRAQPSVAGPSGAQTQPARTPPKDCAAPHDESTLSHVTGTPLTVAASRAATPLPEKPGGAAAAAEGCVQEGEGGSRGDADAETGPTGGGDVRAEDLSMSACATPVRPAARTDGVGVGVQGHAQGGAGGAGGGEPAEGVDGGHGPPMALRAEARRARREALKQRYEQRQLEEQRREEEKQRRAAEEHRRQQLEARVRRMEREEQRMADDERRRAEAELRRRQDALARLHYGRTVLLNHGWRPWRAWVEERRVANGVADTHAAQSLGRKALRAWRGEVAAAAEEDAGVVDAFQARWVARRGMAAWQQLAVVGGFRRAWLLRRALVGLAEEAACELDRADRAAQAVAAARTRRALFAWSQLAAVEREDRLVREAHQETRAIAHDVARAKRGALRVWREGVAAQKEERAREERRSQRWTKINGWLAEIRSSRPATAGSAAERPAAPGAWDAPFLADLVVDPTRAASGGGESAAASRAGKFDVPGGKAAVDAAIRRLRSVRPTNARRERDDAGVVPDTPPAVRRRRVLAGAAERRAHGPPAPPDSVNAASRWDDDDSVLPACPATDSVDLAAGVGPEASTSSLGDWLEDDGRVNIGAMAPRDVPRLADVRGSSELCAWGA